MNERSYSRLGWSYSLPSGILKDSYEAKSYMAGSYNFKVIDMEVWAICI